MPGSASDVLMLCCATRWIHGLRGHPPSCQTSYGVLIHDNLQLTCMHQDNEDGAIVAPHVTSVVASRRRAECAVYYGKPGGYGNVDAGNHQRPHRCIRRRPPLCTCKCTRKWLSALQRVRKACARGQDSLHAGLYLDAAQTVAQAHVDGSVCGVFRRRVPRKSAKSALQVPSRRRPGLVARGLDGTKVALQRD